MFVSKLFLVATIAIAVSLAPKADATTIIFQNNCGQGLNVIATQSGQGPNSICDLQPGESCTAQYQSETSINYCASTGTNTLAEFTFNSSFDNLDFYDLSVVDGYDTPMRLVAPDGTVLTCQEPNCPDAYDYPTDDSKTHSCQSGGTYTLIFCP